MINTVIVLGGFVNSLGVVRQAGRMGLDVIVVTKKDSNLACYSRYVKKYFYYSTDEELCNVFKNNVYENATIYPTSDEDVEFLDKNRAWLKELYNLPIPDSATIQLFAEKTNSYQFAENNGIAYPKSFYMDANGEIKGGDDLVYPIVLKPSVMYDFRDKIGKKAFICHSEAEVKEKCQIIRDAGYPLETMIVQEFMSGGPSNLYSVGVFAINGEIKKQIQVNRLRQRPMILGNSTTYCESSNIAELYDTAERIMRLTKYTGVAEIEFMQHNGQYKFLEVNMRSWKWHSISNMYGFSFLGEWIKYLNGEESGEKTPEVRAAWVERMTDYIVSIPAILKGNLKIVLFLKSYCRRKEHAIWDICDIKPAIVYPLHLAKNLLRKIK